MSRLCDSHLRLADSLAEAYERFAREVDPLATALRECLPDERVEIAVHFMDGFTAARERLERDCRRAVVDSLAREREHAG